MAKLTQRDKVILFMVRHHGYITSMDGSDATLRIVDVRKRISELRRLGYPITDEWVTNPGLLKEEPHVRYKLFYLEGWQEYAKEFGDG